MTDQTASFYPSTISRGARLVWPEGGVKLELGMSLRDAVEQLRDYKPESPLDIICDDQNPLLVDIIIDMSLEGIRLRFDPLWQRLRMFDIYNLNIVTLLHSGSAAFCGKVDASFECIYRIFGPTYPGKLESVEKEQQLSTSSSNHQYVFNLQYPGLSFRFPVPLNKQDMYLPHNTPDADAPKATRLFVFYGEEIIKSPLPPLHSIGLEYMEPVHLNLFNSNGSNDVNQLDTMKVGITFPRSNGDVKIILYESTPQDVMSILGPPQTVYYCEKIDAIEGNGADYFYNYPEAGIDIKFSGESHYVIKIHMTCNLPGHVQFLEYDRCHFRIPMKIDNSKINNNNTKKDIKEQSSISIQSPPPPPPPVIVESESTNTVKPEGVEEKAAEVEVVAEELSAVALEPVVQVSKNKKKKKGKAVVEVVSQETVEPPVPVPVPPVVPPVPPPSTAPVVEESKHAPTTTVPSQLSSNETFLSPGSLPDEGMLTFQTPWCELESQIFFDDKEKKPQPVVHNNGVKNPFQSTEIYCGEPHCRALFEVARSGFLCGVTLY